VKKKNLSSVLVAYEEIDFDHCAFMFSEDKGYFSKVLKLLETYNPVPEQVKHKE
jgi:hypothetical protein